MLNMASGLHQNVALKAEQSDCKEMHLVLNSPLGKMQISGCEKGIHEIKLQPEAVLERSTKGVSFTCEVSEKPEKMTASLKQCVAWLETYFHEPWMTEEIPIPAFHHPIFQQDSFTRKVLETLLNHVKSGETVAYKKLAELSGNSNASRAVGGAMKSNPIPIIIPCHRVIRSSGEIGSYMGEKENGLKEWLLAHEKIQKRV